MEDIDWSPDKANSVSSATGRLVLEGQRAAQVGPEATSKAQIAALMDLLDLHLSRVDVGHAVAPDQVILRVPKLTTEARGALGTLINALTVGIRVQVLEGQPPAGWVATAVGWDLADHSEYSRWPGLLNRPRPVPSLVSAIVSAADLPALRAYPMLSTIAGWSLRLEGLEVGRANAKEVRLQVGKEGKNGDRSLQRDTWVTATGQREVDVTSDATEAASMITSFASAWQALGATSADHDEHALESRILRGATAVDVAGRSLTLIERDPIVNWGSQFPTKWGPAGKARYLDALLRDGSTPWAIEMKVQGGGGVGQYYRHAVAQAVLYREFIRQATPLHPWFDTRGLEAPKCEAAVVVPRMTNPRHAQSRDRVARLCEAFAVEFVEVDPSHALRH